MILDALQMFDIGHQISASAGTEASTNVLDYSTFRDMGIGDGPALKILCQVVTTFTSTNAATLTAELQGSTDNSTFTTMVSSLPAALTGGNLTAGTRLLEMDLPRPVKGQAVPRYLRILYTVGTGVFSVGNVTAGLVLDRQDYYAYPPGVVVVN